MMARDLVAIDLFAGCGGLSLGMKKAGFKILYANEINPDAALTYSHNFPKVDLEISDIRKTKPEKVAKKISISLNHFTI